MIKNKSTLISYAFLAACLFGFFTTGTMLALLSGFATVLIHEKIVGLAKNTSMFTKSAAAKIVATLLLYALLAGLLSLLASSVKSIVVGAINDLVPMLSKLEQGIDAFKLTLPQYLSNLIPSGSELLHTDFKSIFVSNIHSISAFGMNTLKTIGYCLIGIICGILYLLNPIKYSDSLKPLAKALSSVFSKFYASFEFVATAQVKISAINAILTAVFLLVLLPFFDVYIPYAKTVALLTFIFGLIPIVGNLITNTIIFLLGLTVSPMVGVASLAYLVVTHKFEFLINAKIMSGGTSIKPIEILIAIISFEIIFGVYGIVMAPIIYNFIKSELIAHELI